MTDADRTQLRRNPPNVAGHGPSYDYVVVGAGAAGCVLAARLSEDAGTSVLLLEAGPPDTSPAIRVPAAMTTLFGSEYDWDYETVAQQAADGRTVTWPSGRTLGGSSSLNAMIHVHGHRLDYDGWRDRYGCAGWGYADLLPYFRRAERELRVGGPRHRHRLTRAWLAAAHQSGLPACDFRTGEANGVGYFPLNLSGGKRWSAADAYLRPATRRPNLTVATRALATRVGLDGDRATGVWYHQDGYERHATASAEVILAAGTIGSPQLLLRSGIGPADHLRELGIPVMVELPAVGEGLQDHPRVTAIWQVPRDPGPRWLAAARWRLSRSGPLAGNGGEAGGFLRTRPGLEAPDLQLLACPPSPLDSAQPSVAVLVTAVDVASRGRLRLRSADPAVPPEIDPGYLTDPADLAILVAGVVRAREIAGQPPFARYATAELAPGPAVGDEDQLRSWVRATVVTLHHATSTCAMGAAATAVCDPRLRVRGVGRLRVVDASVMPAVPRGNTHGPTVALAERAADLIRTSD